MKKVYWYIVSTHAPLRGATVLRANRDTDLVFLLTRLCEARPAKANPLATITIISTHAPLRGATVRDRTLEGFWDISTHAPLRGATAKVQYHRRKGMDFYSRASARRDLIETTSTPHSFLFLLTRLCEARRPTYHRKTRTFYFYSRASARRDD